MALPKVARYINNVGKSMVYASMDIIKEDMPTISAIATHDSNKEVYKAIYSGIRDYKTTFTRATKYVKSSKVYKAADLAVKSAAEDIISGKWYNAERSRQLEEAAASAMFGDEEDDWDFDSDSESGGSSTEISRGDKLIAAATEVSSHKAASMVSSTIVTSAKAQIEATQASTNFLYAQNAKLMGELRSDIVNTGTRAIQEQTKTNTILENLASNSQKFFENTSKQLQDLVALQKEAVEMQRNLYGDARNKQKPNSNKIEFDDLLSSDGVLDLKTYGKSIKRNAYNVLSEKTGGMLDTLMQDFGDKSALELFATNPLGTLTTGLLRGGMSKQLQASLKRLDKTVAGAMGTVISRMNNMAKDEDGNIISQMFGRVFGFKIKEKTSIDVSKFTKGPVPFDGITRGTINNAIPVYLARIESALTGNAPRIYNAYTGRWQTSRQLGEEFTNMGKQAISSGTSEVAAELVKYILEDKRYKAGSYDDKNRLADNVNKFLEALYKRGGDYKLKSYEDWFEMGVDNEDIFRIIMGAFRNMPGYKRMQTAQQVMDAKNNYSKRLAQMEADGSVYSNIFSGAFDKKHLYGDGKKYEDEPKSGLANSLSLAKDDKGKDIWYYLQNMYTELYRVRQAIGGGNGIPGGLYGTGKQYRELNSPIIDTHEKTNRDKYNDSVRNARMRYDEEIQQFKDEGGKIIDIQDGETMRRVMANLSADDREKAKRDLQSSSNFFQKALYDNQWDLDSINTERKKHNKSELKGKFLDVFKEATLDEKLKMAGNYLSKLTSKPNEWATKMVEAADNRIYKLLYGEETGKEDENGNKIKGVMNYMTFKFNQTLNNMTTWADEHIFSPIKKKLGIESFSDVLDKIGITDLFKGISNKILGEKGPNGREGGFLSEFGKKFSESITEKAKNADNWFKDAFSNVFAPIKNKLGLNDSKQIGFYDEQEFDLNNFTGPNTTITSIKNGKVQVHSKAYATYAKQAKASGDEFHETLLRMVGEIYSIFKRKNVIDVCNDMMTGRKKWMFNAAALVRMTPATVFDDHGRLNSKTEKLSVQSLLTQLINYIDHDIDTVMNLPELYAMASSGNSQLEDAADRIITDFFQAKNKAKQILASYIPKLMDTSSAYVSSMISKLNEEDGSAEILKQIQEVRTEALGGLTEYEYRLRAFNRDVNYNLNNNDGNGKRFFIDLMSNEGDAFKNATGDAASKFEEDYKFTKEIANIITKFKVPKNLVQDMQLLLWSLKDSGRSIIEIKRLSANELFNAAINSGKTELAAFIDDLMLNTYNNRDLTVSAVVRGATASEANTANNIFSRATETLEKIYNLLLISLGDNRRMSDKEIELVSAYDEENIDIINRITHYRARESKTESGEDSHQDEPPEAHAFGGFFKKRGLSALSEGEIYGRNGLYGKVPKTGVYDVKAGTTIYPTKSGDKAIELAKEQRAIEDFIKSNANGDNANTKTINGRAYTEIINESGESVWVRQGDDGKWYKLDETSLLSKMGQTVKQGATAVAEAYNTSNRNLNREERIKIDGTNPKAIARDIRKNIPEISASAALGAAAGLLFGNPLLGAAIGGSISAVKVSDTAKDILFGKEVEDAEGNTSRSGGFVSKNAQETFKKYFPSMSQHAAVGATLGLFTPFGLVGGALLGSAAGFVQKNEAAHIALFGTPDDENSGIISKKSRDKLKKLAPNLFVGAASAALLGPFGLVGNIALGAGLGMASTTDEFQNAILGEEVEIAGVKTRVGGLVGTLNTEIIIPLKDWGKDFAENTSNFFKDKVLTPLSEAFVPIITEIGHLGRGAIKLIPKTMEMLANTFGGTPLGATFAKMVQAPKALVGYGAKAAGTIAKGTILAPVTAISAVGKGLRNKQIRGGYANYMTAQERLDYRAANNKSGNTFGGANDTYNQIDKTLAGASSEEIQKAIKATKLLISTKDFKSDIRSKRRKIKAVLIEFFETKTYKQLERMVNKDQFSELIKAIQASVPRQGVTEQQKRDIIELITSLQEDIRDFHSASRKNKTAKRNAYAALHDAGFTGVTEKNIDKFYASLRNEEAAHKASDLKINPEQQHMEDTVTNVGSMLGEKLDAIIKALTSVEEEIKEETDPKRRKNKPTDTAESPTEEVIEEVISDIPTPKRTLRDRVRGRISAAKNKLAGKISGYGLSAIKRIEGIKSDDSTTKQKSSHADRLAGIESMHFDDDSNSVISLRGVDAFRGRLNEKESSFKERIYYDSDSNAVRVFRRTLHGWKEVPGKAKTDADKQEDSDDKKKMNMFAKILAKVRNKDEDDDDKDKKKGGIWSKIKGFLGKGLGLLGKLALGVTAAAGLGHGIDFAKDKLVPGLKTWWTETAAPWLEAKVGPKLNGIYDFLNNLPERIMDGTKNVFKWVGEHKDTILKWYTDGIQSLSGYIAGGFKWVVSNIWPILGNLVKYGIWPAIKGIGQGVASWFKPNKVPDLRDEQFKMSVDSNIDSSPLDSIIDGGNQASSRLGLSKMDKINNISLPTSSMISVGVPAKEVQNEDGTISYVTKTEATLKANELNDKLAKAKTPEEKKAIIAEMAENAYWGKMNDGHGGMLDYYDHDLMAKDNAGNTIGYDENGNIVQHYDASAKENKLASTFGRMMLTGNKGYLVGLAKYGGKGMAWTGRGISRLGKLTTKVPSIGAKALGYGTRMVGGATQATGGFLQATSTAIDLMPTAAGNNNTIGKLVKLIESALGKLMEFKPVKKLLAKAVGEGGGEVTEELIKKKGAELVSKVSKKVEVLLQKFTRKASNGVFEKIGSVLKSAAKLLGPIFIATDFISGWNNAESYLGVVKESGYEVTFVQRLVCALANVLNGKFLVGIVPIENIVDILVDVVLPMFGADVSKLSAARQQSKALVMEYNSVHGTDYDVSSYNKKDSVFTKLKKLGSDGIAGIKEGAKSLGSGAVAVGKKWSDNMKNIISGKPGELIDSIKDVRNEDGSISPSKVAGSIASGIATIGTSPILAVSTGVRAISENFDKIKNGISTSAKDSVAKREGMLKSMLAGDPMAILSAVTDIRGEGGEVETGKLIGSAFAAPQALLTAVPAALISAVKTIGSGVKNVFNTGVTTIGNIAKDHTAIAKLRKKGDVQAVYNFGLDDKDKESPFAGLRQGLIGIQKIWEVPLTGLFSVGNKVMEFFGLKNNIDIKGWMNKMAEYGDTKKKPSMEGFDKIGVAKDNSSLGSILQNLVASLARGIGGIAVNIMRNTGVLGKWVSGLLGGATSGEGSDNTDKTTTAYGTGRAYQKDPAVANIQFNKAGDSRRQTIGDSGCGPAAAVNAVNYAYGTGNSLITAAKTAINYKEKDGGTRPEFFNRYFKSQGLSSARLSGPAEIERNIRNGNPTVLMGRDPKGGAATPYGPNPHYVTAKGFDSRGHIIIDDPESPSGSVAYDKKKVLGKTTVAVGASRHGRSKWGRSKWGMASSPAPGDIEGTKKVIWSFLLSKGYTETSAAAIMGNIGQECSFKYHLKESGGKGPGIGICQWTYKTRKAAFLAAVPDWETNLMGQLNFMWSEISSGYKQCLPETLNTYTDLYAAVRHFHDIYEGSADATMNNRNKYALQVYQQFTGSTPVTLPEGSSGGAFSSQVANNLDLSSGQNTVMGQLGQKVGNLVKSALSAEYGDTRLSAIFGSDFSSNNDTSTTAPSTTIQSTPDITSTTQTNINQSVNTAANLVAPMTKSAIGNAVSRISGMGSGNRAKYGMGVGGLYTVQISAVFDDSGKKIDVNPPKETSGGMVGMVKDNALGQTIQVLYTYKNKAGDKSAHRGYISESLAKSLGLPGSSATLVNTAAKSGSVGMVAATSVQTKIATTVTRTLDGPEKMKIGFTLIHYKNTPYINLQDNNAKQVLESAQRSSGKVISETDSKKQIWWIVKNYWHIDLEAMAKFAKDIAVYKDNTIGQLRKDNNELYSKLHRYAIAAQVKSKSQEEFEKLTVGYFCEKAFGLKFDGESVAAPSGDDTTVAGSDMVGFDTASGVSTEASSTSMGSIFDMFKSAFASAFDYTDSDGNKQNLLSLLGLGGSSSGSSGGAASATGGAVTGTATGVQGDMANNFPYYNQSDPAWGSIPYGREGTISSSGCGPTSMAMVAKSYGANVTPEDTMKWSLNNGHRIYGSGTSWNYFKAYGNSIGVQTEQTGSSANFMTNKLRNGIPIISSMKPGHFTKGGHFIVLSGIDDQGNILVNDPASKERSGQKWSPDIVAGESKQMWAISRDGKGSIGTLSQDTADKISEQTDNAGSLVASAANTLQNGFTSNIMGMGSGNYAKYGRGVTPAQTDYTQILKAMAMSLDQLVENTSLLAQIIQIITSPNFGGGNGMTPEQAAAIAQASAKSASTMRDKMNNMLNLSGKNMGNIISGRDANSIIQTMTQIASE